MHQEEYARKRALSSGTETGMPKKGGTMLACVAVRIVRD